MDKATELMYRVLIIGERYKKEDKPFKIDLGEIMCGTKFTEEQIKSAEVKYND